MDKRKLGRGLLLTAVVLLVVLGFVYRDEFDSVQLQAWLESLGVWAPVVFVLIYAMATVLFLPALVLTILGGALFGPVMGTLFNLGGATLGATLAFLVARYLAADWVEHKVSGKMASLKHGIEEEGWRFVAFTRLVPLFPFNLLNYALGLTRIGLLPYLLASLVFMLPGTFAYSYLGHAGRQAVSGDEDLVQSLLLALALLGALAFLPSLVKRLRKGKSPAPEKGETD